MAQLVLRTFGNPTVQHGDMPADLPTRKTLALLIYLMIESGMHTRERLAAILWPESTSGRANLRNTLAHLRSALSHAGTETHHLHVERNALGINATSDIWCDVEVIREALSDDARLEAAVDAYRGDFLDGFSLGDAPEFDDWASIHREKWHREMETIFDRLSQQQSEAGKTRTAIGTVNRWLEVAPLSERAYRRLMRLHFAAGERAVALRIYATCCDMLEQELGVPPAPETEALVEKIRSETPPRQPPRRGATAETKPNLRELPIVGRGREHAALVETYYTTRRGNAQVVLLEGEAGIGKTRLAGEFLAWARAHDAYAVSGGAVGSGGRLPYQPIVRILRSLLDKVTIWLNSKDRESRGAEVDGSRGAREQSSRSPAPQHSISLAQIWLSELSRLLPELFERYPDLPPAPPMGDATARTRLFEAVTRLGMAMAEQRPVLLCIDDVQWSDSATLDLLQYVAARWHEQGVPLLVILSVRAEALVRSTRSDSEERLLRDWIADLERDVPLTRLTLKSLSEEQTRELVETLAGAEEQESRDARELGRSTSAPQHPSSLAHISEWLYAETEGHPFYISETLETLLERDLIRPRRLDSGDLVLDFDAVVDEQGQVDETLHDLLPPGIHRVIRARLDRLTRPAFSLLAAGAVLGTTFSFRSLCRVAGLQDESALAALDQALALRMLTETSEADRPYTFAHDKIRDVVYTEAGDARRRLFHQRAYDVRRAADAASAELAHHALKSRKFASAVQHSIDAGDAAMELFAVYDAIAQYRQARRILREQSDVDIDFGQREHLYTKLGRAYEIVGELDAAAGVFESLREHARGAGREAVESLALNRLAFIRAQQHDVEAASALIEEAMSLAERTGDTRALAESHWNVAQLGLYGGDVAGMRTHGERALTLARELNDAELIARCLNVLAYTERNHGRARSAIEYAEEARRIYADMGNLALEADCLGVLTQANVMAGRPDAAVADARTALQISREIQSNYGVFFSSLVLMFALVDCGEYDEALTLAEELVAEARARDEHPRTTMALVALSMVQRAVCAFEDACKTDEEALRLSEAGATPIPLASVAAMNLCADYALLGEWDTACTYVRQSIEIENGVWLFLAGMIPWWLKVEALLHLDDRDEAQAVIARLKDYAGEYRRLRIPHLRSCAVLAERDGALQQAISHLEKARALADEIGLPGERWRILTALAALYEELENAKAADETIDAAAETVQMLAAGMSAERRAAFLRAERVRQVLERGTETSSSE